MSELLRVTVWGENVHERNEPEVRALYPDGMHAAIAAGLTESLGERVQVRTATLEQPEHGLGGDVLAETDVLTWWGHIAHDEVSDEVVARVHEAVLGGMGLLVLHSAHYSKIFKRLLGTPCDLRWRNEGERELVWTVAPSHPIAAGVPNPIEIEAQEMYGEPFAIPRARGADLHLQLRRRRGLPRRLHLDARRGPDLLLQPGRPGLPRLPPSGHQARAGQRGAVGGAAAAHAAEFGSPQSPVGWWR